jgi:hypothetical protein
MEIFLVPHLSQEDTEDSASVSLSEETHGRLGHVRKLQRPQKALYPQKAGFYRGRCGEIMATQLAYAYSHLIF